VCIRHATCTVIHDTPLSELARPHALPLPPAGEDLLLAANDQPFRFPATFTFVVRSFTVLDGIGKSLDPRFDISEISAPYARELLLEGRPQVAKLWEDFKKRAGNQNRAVVNLFKGPNQIEGIADVMARLVGGGLDCLPVALYLHACLHGPSVLPLHPCAPATMRGQACAHGGR
jgi:hypothetical protein